MDADQPTAAPVSWLPGPKARIRQEVDGKLVFEGEVDMPSDAESVARLISAAPDLLTALKYALENIQGIADGDDIPSTAIREMGWAAIKKATGSHG